MANPRLELKKGFRIGSLSLLHLATAAKTGSYNTRKRWRVLCDCGQRITVAEYYLVRKPFPKTHCGCQQQTFQSTHKPEYNCWSMMHTRCEDPKHIGYRHYGGRGISIDPRWHKTNPNGLENFVEDMGRRPIDPKTQGYKTLDRFPDPNGNYTKSNCRWATWSEQNSNKR